MYNFLQLLLQGPGLRAASKFWRKAYILFAEIQIAVQIYTRINVGETVIKVQKKIIPKTAINSGKL